MSRGVVAQLVERLNRIQEVMSSILIHSIDPPRFLAGFFIFNSLLTRRTFSTLSYAL